MFIMNKVEVLDAIREAGVLPVIRAANTDEAKAVVKAILAGGITVFEITMTVPGAVGLIAELSKNSQLLIGAGTVLDPESARECIGAGARFIISPATNFETIDYCNEHETLIMPGALTPTEVVNAVEAGADVIKIFPASSMGGPSYLKALKAPLPHIKLIPTGGVNLSNAGDYIKAGAEAIGIGGELVDLKAIRAGTPESITKAAEDYLAVVRSARA